MDAQERRELLDKISIARKKMVIAYQNGNNKKAWRKRGKDIVKLSRQLGIPVEPWMERAFGRAVEEAK